MPTPTTVQARFQVRADTAANWTSANPTLLLNEIGIETDTKKLKMGDGTTAWSSLAYFPSIVAGGTVLGNLEIGTTGTLTFEGSTADGFETTLAVVDPTADRTITLPNATGTVILNTGGQTIEFGAGAQGTPSITTVGDLDTGIWFPAGGNTLAVSTGGSERFRITSAGLVGIGTSSPGVILDIRETATGATTAISLFNTDNTNSTSQTARIGLSPDSRGAALAGLEAYKENSDFSTSAARDVSLALNVLLNNAKSEAVRITSAGRVGVGTTSPGQLIQIGEGDTGVGTNVHSIARIEGRAVAGGQQVATLEFNQVTNAPGEFVGASIGIESSAGTRSESELVFKVSQAANTNATEAMRLSHDGRLGIGTTSPGAPLTVVAQSNAQAINIRGRSSDNIGELNIFSNDEATNYAKLSARSTYVELRGPSSGEIRFNKSDGTQFATIDSSGRLLVGTSSYFDNGISADSQLLIANTTVGHIATTTWSASNNGAYLTLGRSRGTSIGSNTAVAENDELGVLVFAGDNGSSLVNRAAQIAAYVDGEVGTAGDTTDMPGRLVFSTSADGASSPTEQWRLTNDGVQALRQATPAAVDTTATLTVAQLKGRIITSSTAAAVTMTLPSGTDTEAGFSGIYTNMAFEWYVINTGATNAVTVQAGTAHTLVGSGSVAANTSGHFMSRRTAANTFVTYRLSS